MKLLISLVIFIALIFASCTEESPKLTNPINQSSNGNPNWIQLPEREGMGVENQFSVTKYVSKQNGGELIIDEQYSGGPHGLVKVFTKFKIDGNTVPQSLNVTMSINDETGVINFTPSTAFNKSSELYIKFEGLDLYGINPDEVDFIFTINGSLYEVIHEDLIVDVSKGKLEFKAPSFIVVKPNVQQNVMILPDGRYGWIRNQQ